MNVNTIKYALAEAINKVIPFLLLPFITRYISPEEYSKLDIYMMYLTFYQMLCWFNQNTYFAKNYHKEGDDEKYLALFLPVIINIVLLVPVTLLSVVFFEMELYFIPFLSVVVICQLVFLLKQISNQYSGNVNGFVKYQLTISLVNALLSFYLVYSGYGADGRALGMILPVVAVSIYILFKDFKLINRKLITVTKEDLNSRFKFGFSLLPYNFLNGWLKDNLARIIIINVVGVSGVLGIYSVTFLYSTPFVVMSNSLMMVYGPKIFKSDNDLAKINDLKASYGKIIVSLFFILALCLYLSFPYVVGNGYSTYENLVLIFVFSFAINAFTLFNNSVLISFNKTSYVSYNIIISVLSYFFAFLALQYFEMDTLYALSISYALGNLVGWRVSFYKVKALE